MERRVATLRRAGTAVEYHRYPGVGHGFGLGVGTSAEGWIANAVDFWLRHTDRPNVERAAVPEARDVGQPHDRR